MNIVTTRRQLLQAGVSPLVSAADEWSCLCAELRAATREQQRLFGVYLERETLAEERVREVGPGPAPLPSQRIDTALSLDMIVKQIGNAELSPAQKAHDRAVAKWKERCAAIEAEALGNSAEQWEAALAHEGVLATRLKEYPVATLAQLNEKATILHERFGEELEASEALALVRDIQRLAEAQA